MCGFWSLWDRLLMEWGVIVVGNVFIGKNSYFYEGDVT